MQELTGKVAVVTGAAAGIGRATAEVFAAEGARVVLADVDDDRGEEVAAGLVAKGFEAVYVHADVADDAQVESLVRRAVDTFGGLDAAFNNAGIEGLSAATHEWPPAMWSRVLAVNLTGVWSCMRHEIPAMLVRGGGTIVNCASVAGLVGFAGSAGYTASKHGVVGLTRAAALDYAASGIRVNAICPGVIDTEMVERVVAGRDDLAAGLLAMEPIGRMGRPAEVAEAALWLCSDRSSFTTGQAVAVDGGFVAR